MLLVFADAAPAVDVVVVVVVILLPLDLIEFGDEVLLFESEESEVSVEEDEDVGDETSEDAKQASA